MRVYITGSEGQLGQSLREVLTEQGYTILDAPYWDITEHDIVDHITALRPDVVIHAAAMTDVDGAAKDPDAAFRVNAFGSQNVAHACLRANADMVYISTNEVFDGQTDHPYFEGATPAPINPYGHSKRSGEQMASRYLRGELYVVRTAWLYGPGGNNFPEKIIAAAEKHGKLRVVADEISNPTYTIDLANALAELIQTRAFNTYHLVNKGHCSRFEFAQEILRLAGMDDIPIEPITLAEYQRASVVPPYTPLANNNAAALGIELRPWEEALAAYVARRGGK